MAVFPMVKGVPSGDGIFHKTYASVASNSITTGFQPSKIYVSFILTDGSVPVECCYDSSLSTSMSVQSYKNGASINTRALAFASMSSSDAMISAVSSTGFTVNNLTNTTNIEVVAIP